MPYKPLMQARDVQKTALDRLAGRKAFALLMAMRTGKSKVLLDDFGRLELANQASDLIVIAPGGAYKTWIKAIAEHVSLDLQRRAKIFVWNSNARSAKAIKDFVSINDAPRILLMNVEALSVVKDARLMCEAILRGGAAMLAIDESTCIKNFQAKRSKYVVDHLGPLAAYRRILSGLPTPRSPLDLFMQFKFLDSRILGFTNFYTFRAHYAIVIKEKFGGRFVDIVKGYKNEKELAQKIEPHSYRVEFRPNIPSTYEIYEVPLTDEQKRIYGELKEYATSSLSQESHVTATIVIAQLMRMHQVLCGHTKDELGKFHEIPECRTQALLDLLDDYGGKAIIWCSYDYNIKKVVDALQKEYGPNSVSRFWGGNAKERDKEEHTFLTQPECRFMVATPSAGGMGRTWTVADLVVYYSSKDNLEHREQSEQRAQGVDKKRQVDYVDLIAPNTIEIKILQALRKKINMATLINGDNYREWLI